MKILKSVSTYKYIIPILCIYKHVLVVAFLLNWIEMIKMLIYLLNIAHVLCNLFYKTYDIDGDLNGITQSFASL